MQHEQHIGKHVLCMLAKNLFFSPEGWARRSLENDAVCPTGGIPTGRVYLWRFIFVYFVSFFFLGSVAVGKSLALVAHDGGRSGDTKWLF